MIVFGIVYGLFTLIFQYFFIADTSSSEGLLPQSIANVLLVGQDILNHLP